MFRKYVKFPTSWTNIKLTSIFIETAIVAKKNS